MFKGPNEHESTKALVHRAMGEQIDCKLAFWVPILIAVVLGAVSIGVLSLVLSMDLIDLLYDRGKQLRLRVLVPVATFLVTLVLGYLYFCVAHYFMRRKKLLKQAHLTYRNTTYEIFQRAVDYKQLDIDQRMIILVAALEPLKEIIFPDQEWDKRGRKYVEVFIQQVKRTLKALMVDLDLLEMHKETKLVIDETIEDKFVVDATATAPPAEPELNLALTPFKSTATKSTAAETVKGKAGKAEEKKETRSLKQQQETIDNLQPEGFKKIMGCKEKNARKLLHLDFVFKLYMPLWCLEYAHKGDYVSYQEMKESENSIKKMKMLELLRKTSFLTTRQHEKFVEFFNNSRINAKIFGLQRRSPLMHKSRRNLESTLIHFSIYPGDVKNNHIVKRIEGLMNGHIGIQAKIRYPVIVIGDDGVEIQKYDVDSLYVDDPNKQQQILNTQVSISIEIADKKKD